MKLITQFAFLLNLTSPYIIGQSSPKGKSPLTSRFEVDAIDAPDSIEDLLSISTLVVIGTVDSVLPARLTNKVDPDSVVESDVVVLVDKVLKGSALSSQKTFKRVLLSQLGGWYQGRLYAPARESLLEAGDRHILFLQPDPRAGLPIVAGLPRFAVVGVWSGKFRVERLGGVRASQKASKGLHVHDSITEADFNAVIGSAIAKNPALGK